MRKRVEPSTCFPSRVWRATVLLGPTRATINPLMALSLRSNPSSHPSLVAPLISPTPVGAPTRILSVTYSSVSLSHPVSFLSPLPFSRCSRCNLLRPSRAPSAPLLHRPLSSVHLSRAASLQHPFLREQLHPPCLYHCPTLSPLATC